MRLDKALTLTGLTRSQARKAISQGRAAVNGVAARDAGMEVVPGQVSLDGSPIAAETDVTLMLHKPAGVLTATSDRHCRTVVDLVPPEIRAKELGPVGRLDKDVTGLVILTTDGQLAHRLISPKREVAKVYVALTDGEMSENDLETIRAGGLEFSDFISKPAGAESLGGCRIKLTLTEGKYHEVKRICAKMGHPVVELARISIAGVTLDPQLEPGQCRKLTDEELSKLYTAAGMVKE